MFFVLKNLRNTLQQMVKNRHLIIMEIALKMKINTYYAIIYVVYVSFVYTDLGSYDETLSTEIVRKIHKIDQEQ